MQWATKWQKIKGRVCYNASKKTKSAPSLNEATCINDHDGYYPEMPLPSMHEVAEMSCQVKEANPGQRLAGAAIDVQSAYQQCVSSTEASKHTTTLAKYYDSSLRKWVVLLIVYLVVTFGYTRAGHTYATFGRCIDYHHNLQQPRRRSYTYVDDGILVDTVDNIDRSMDDYIKEITDLFGSTGVTEDKTKKWEGMLEAVGWVYDFDKWVVYPKQKGLQKMMAYLFKLVPPGTRFTTVGDLQKVTGVLCWYATAIPAGRSFLSSLYKCQSNKKHSDDRKGKCGKGSLKARVYLTDLAISDLNWWRALVLVAYKCPSLIGDSIDHLRVNLHPNRFLQTDASTTIGGGGVVSLTEGGTPLVTDGNAIRWTRAERELFTQLNISINVLEYFAVVYYVMLWSEHFTGKVVSIECDNMSAVSWILHNRVKGGEGVDIIAKVFTMFCLTHNIILMCKHIKGVDNVVADFNSRDLTLLPQEGDEALFHGTPCSLTSRQVCCRRLLIECLLRPDQMLGLKLLEKLMEVRGEGGSSIATSSA